MRHKDGTYRWIESTVMNLLDDPAIHGVVGNYRDITDRRRGAARQQFLLDASQQLTVALEDEDALVAVAGTAVPGFAEGCSVELLGGTGKLRRAFTALPHNEDAVNADPFASTSSAAYVARALITGQSALFAPAISRSASQNGGGGTSNPAGADTLLVAPLVARGVTLGAVSFATSADAPFDHADRGTVEEFAGWLALALAHARHYREVQVAETRYRLLFDSIRDAAIVADADGNYTDANPAFTDLLGYTVDEVRQRRIGAFAPDSEAGWEAFTRHRGDATWHWETELKRKDGTLVPVEGETTTVPLPGRLLYLSTWRDISERRASEQSQREFIAMITHELRNPLSSLKGFAQLMQRRQQYDAKAIETIIAQADRLERLTRDLRDVARFADDTVEITFVPLALPALIAAAVREVSATVTLHTFRTAVPADLPPVRGDRDRVMQVLQNLLSNAVKYSPKGGEIAVRAWVADTRIAVSVTDEGIGIPPEAMANLFGRFYRAENAREGSAGGMGVGLHLSRAFVEAHGGTLTVDSTPGVGSTFTFTLPIADPPT